MHSRYFILVPFAKYFMNKDIKINWYFARQRCLSFGLVCQKTRNKILKKKIKFKYCSGVKHNLWHSIREDVSEPLRESCAICRVTEMVLFGEFSSQYFIAHFELFFLWKSILYLFQENLIIFLLRLSYTVKKIFHSENAGTEVASEIVVKFTSCSF